MRDYKDNKIQRNELFYNRKQPYQYGRYLREKRVSAMIAAGEEEELRSMLTSAWNRRSDHDDAVPYQKKLYGVVIGIAIASRAAMDGGLSEETAFSFGDSFISEADDCKTEKELWELYVRAVTEFAGHVHENKKKVGISETIQSAMDYILQQLHHDITLKEIADYAELSETYFSALFKKETGETVSEFIQKSRVREAQSLLQYSDYSLMEIAQYLGFCSQSHFSKTFRKFSGTTPGQYRKQYFKRIW